MVAGNSVIVWFLSHYRQIKESSNNQAVFAASCGPDNLNHAWQAAKNILEENNVHLDTPYFIEFGIKKWSLSRGGHRAVIIKVNNGLPGGNDQIAFRLELDIDLKDEQKSYVAGDFACPAIGCTLKTKSFTELANHHLEHHRTPQGDNIQYRCCGQTFYIFESYAAHVYEKHQNINSVTLEFQKIIPEKYEKFLDEESVTFFPVHQKMATFQQLLNNGLTVMKNFGKYFIFFWNCQDFASWYLSFNGIPLKIIEPTIPDRVTGSGTESSAR